jgi:hypothetical protein
MLNKNIVKTLLFLIATIATKWLSAQTTFSYDPSGNRIHRDFVVVKSNIVIEGNDTLIQANNGDLLLLLNKEEGSEDSLVNLANETAATITASNEVQISLYPNPTVNTVSITAETEILGGVVYLLNDSGNLLHQQNYQNNLTLQLAHLPKGNYMVRLVTTDQKQFIWNVVKM